MSSIYMLTETLMKLLITPVLILSFFLSGSSAALAAEGVLARCGASTGKGYFFFDELFNPDGPGWTDDGVANGRILLVRLGDEWDIQFGDSIGDYGYRQDGAKVILLGMTDRFVTLGAFGAAYTDIFTFDMPQKEVVWSSHKFATTIKKSAIYHADCSFAMQAQ
jgi:hypothetical protein